MIWKVSSFKVSNTTSHFKSHLKVSNMQPSWKVWKVSSFKKFQKKFQIAHLISSLIWKFQISKKWDLKRDVRFQLCIKPTGFLVMFWRTLVTTYAGLLIPLFLTSGEVCPRFQTQGASLNLPSLDSHQCTTCWRLDNQHSSQASWAPPMLLYKARHAHKRLCTVLPLYSKIQALPGITSCRLMKYNNSRLIWLVY